MKLIDYIIKRINPIKYAKKLGVKVGSNCEFQRDIVWGSEPFLITIGNDVRITQGVKFITHDGGVWVLRNLYGEDKIDVFGKITIGNNVNIGWNVVILPGVTIGDNCVIGAGSIVTKDVESNTIVAGIPAKKIESVDEYYNKVKQKCEYTKKMSYKYKKKYLIEKYQQ